jgi:hypothetical protein
MSKRDEDALPVGDEYVSKVTEWLDATDLSGLPEAAEPIDLPPSDMAGATTVVRPVRLPFELDALVRGLAEARGVSMSSLIREWIIAGLTEAGQAPDPATELRRSLDTARRALDALTSPTERRNAA